VTLNRRAIGAVLVTAAVVAGCSGSSGRASLPSPLTRGTTTTSILPMGRVPQGCAVFSRGGLDGGLHTLDADGTLRRITTDPGDDQAAWSPDGTKIVFNRYTEGDQNVYLTRAQGGTVTRLTTGRSNASPTWSPDGSRILFTKQVAGRTEFFTMKPDGTDLRRQARGRMSDGTPAWSPDGSTIAFVGSGSRSLSLYVMRADGSGRRNIGDAANAAWPKWFPDGTKIAFASEDDGSIHVVDRDGTDPRPVFDVTTLGVPTQPNFTEPAWSPDGTKLVFAAGDAYASHLYLVRVDGSGITQLTNGRVNDESPDWSYTTGCT
jgi:TolB protein